MTKGRKSGFINSFKDSSFVQQQQGPKDSSEHVSETTIFHIDEKQSTQTQKCVLRKRIVKHECENKKWTEVFEDSFFIPLQQLNLNQFISTSESVCGTVLLKKVLLLHRNQSGLLIEIYRVYILPFPSHLFAPPFHVCAGWNPLPLTSLHTVMV